MLIAAVMTLVLAWSIARLVMDSPVELNAAAAVGSTARRAPTTASSRSATRCRWCSPPTGGGAHVVVRDGAGDMVFSGDLAFGESQTLQSVAPPVQVQSSDGSLQVTVDGQDRGTLGTDGQPAQNTFVSR